MPLNDEKIKIHTYLCLPCEFCCQNCVNQLYFNCAQLCSNCDQLCCHYFQWSWPRFPDIVGRTGENGSPLPIVILLPKQNEIHAHASVVLQLLSIVLIHFANTRGHGPASTPHIANWATEFYYTVPPFYELH